MGVFIWQVEETKLLEELPPELDLKRLFRYSSRMYVKMCTYLLEDPQEKQHIEKHRTIKECHVDFFIIQL